MADLWAALAQSVESSFYSAADWQRARMEMFYANELIRNGQPSANQWGAVQHTLSELLVSPAVKRRDGSVLWTMTRWLRIGLSTGTSGC